MNKIVRVCLPNTSRDYFDYLANDGTLPAIGARVAVPFRHKTRIGVVIAIDEQKGSDRALKTILTILDEQPLLSPSILQLGHWVSRYYQSPLSEVMSLMLPKKYRLGEAAQLPYCDYYQLAMPADTAHTLLSRQAGKQHALIDVLNQSSGAVTRKELTQAGFSAAQMNALLKLGVITHFRQADIPRHHRPSPEQPLLLHEEQASAVATILGHGAAYHCFLLQGVTGSGKTEVYLQVIAGVLARERQVLILVPEIGLTPQLLARFQARFDEPMVVIHSGLNERERQQAWHLAQAGRVKLVIGTRAAVFTPMPALGLIVVDEEHDASLKQAEGVRYSARDTALMRAHQSDIPIILGSATPSLESLQNCRQGKYTLLRLRQKAINQNPLHIQIADMRNVLLQHGLAPVTLQAIATHLQNHNQVLVFINRRGFAPVLLCHQCGWMVDCRACDSHMTYHRRSQRVICHHCGLSTPVPALCQHCQSTELIPIGAGTQRLHDYLSEQFPETRVLRVDRDEVRGKHELDARLEQIHRGEAQLIVGTQMLAKGHHFPRLTLVVVVDADAGFYNQDFRALERLGQLLTQVAGRAGRADKDGQVIIQTHLPQHPLLNLLVQEGYDAFASALLDMRQQAALPPYHYLAVIRAQDKKAQSLLQFLHAIKDHLRNQPVQVLGPAPAPLARKAHQHRMQLLLKSPSRTTLQGTLTGLREWITINKLTRNVRWNVDVDPMDLS
ncbi:primosomal protein N' [Legionella spiritensis]|uniref:primosomal protein N' n=1 Tax=Legionella spiritensis TaxID=452 RepID=UPI000F6F6CBB|nr:primosomal protein N' [Legionella spiritensis]VEG91489.1 primosomal protein N' (replication factor Y) (superfamily II helicase) [Legionella spiritensis]